MSNQSRASLATCLLLALIPAASGCAGLRERMAAEPSPGRQRLERKAEIVESFEARRAQAQFEAALDRAAAGDLMASEQMLRAVVARQSDFIDARLKLAELLSLRDDFAAAEAELRSAVASDPMRADAQHALGLLLSVLDRHEESRHHLARAAELEPGNELYRIAQGS